mmetsp:Transcript_1682/g.3223  ORF Transcript_1682/g.3223 Transcript_1682/m.3223 type:complete len:328 (-) Transcript_1682:2066-3049(-)
MEIDEAGDASLSALQLTPAQIARRVTLPLHHDDHVVTRQETSSAAIDLIAGGVAGSAGIVVGHPFDSIKVRMQMASSASTSSAAAISAGSQYGGISTLFRGIGAPFVMAALINSSIFVTYGESGRIWDKYNGSSSFLTTSKQFICGGIAGIVSSLIICPTEHVKIRLQTQKSRADIVYRNTFDAAKRILTSHGFTGLYRGFTSTCLRQSPGFAAYFGTYDQLKEQGQQCFGSDHLWLSSIVAGGVAGSLSWAVVYPIDLIKSRIQALPLTAAKDELTMWSIVAKIVKEQGWSSLYRGFGITVFRAFPVNGIIFPTYELTSAVLNGTM